MTLVILLPNWIGDAVMATPALCAIHNHRAPGERIVGVGRDVVCDLLEGLPYLDERRVLPTRAGYPFSRMLALARDLRSMRADCALFLTDGLGVATAAWLARVLERIGYVRHWRRPFLTRALAPPRGRQGPSVSTIEYYLGLAAALGRRHDSLDMRLATSASDEAAADVLWARFGPRAERPTVVLNNSSEKDASHLWPMQSMAELAGRVVHQLGFNAVLLCGPAEASRAQRTAAMAGEGVFSTADFPSIGLSKACVRRARLLISTDSGPRHFAPAFGVPVVTLFGPTDPNWTHLHTPLELPLRADRRLDDRTVHERAESRMRDLSVDAVWAAALRQLQRFPR